MKPIQVFPPRVSLLALAALSIATSRLASGQVIQFYGVEKRITYLQTSSTAPSTPSTTINDPNGPYFFEAGVIGSNLNQLSSAPTLSGSFTGSPLTLVLKSNGEYGFTGNNPAPKSFSSQAQLDSAFPNGSYSLNNLPLTTPPGTGSVALNLTPNAYPAAVPAITNGTWSGGALQVDAVSGMTLNFSTFAGYSSGGLIEFHLYSMNGANIGSEMDSVTSISVLSNPIRTSYSINPGVLTPGQTYFAELSYGSFTQTDQSSISGALGYALYQDMTGFAITAIPEPSTYGVVAGFFMLGVVVYRRRFRGGAQQL